VPARRFPPRALRRQALAYLYIAVDARRPSSSVSTDRQGKSGLGLEAQRKAVLDFLSGGHWALAAEFVEVESGKRSDRPQLAAALTTCKKLKAKLVIARLDRLARNVHFLSGLMETKIEFVACDMPEATPFMLHIYAAVAEQEAKAISVRTKAALAAAKVRGVKLGGPKLKQAQQNGWKTNTVNADRFAANVRPVIEKLRASGATSLRAIAAELAARNVPTARGGTWTPVQVTAILRRRHDSSSVGPTGG
jgi:DNA invertase Pin-like site-specific DNA recombinase